MPVPRPTLRLFALSYALTSLFTGVVATAALTSSVAEAQDAAPGRRTGAVLEFQGRRSGPARRAVVDGIDEEVDLVAEEDVTAVAGQLGADVTTPEGISRVATELGLSIVVAGEVTGSGRRATTTVRIYDVQGELLVTRDVGNASGRRGAADVGQAAATAVEEALADVTRREEERLAQQQQAAEQARQRIAAEERERPRQRRQAAPPPSKHPFLVAYLGDTIRTRWTRVEHDGPQRAATYDALFHEITLVAELRPFSSGALAGAFAQAEFGLAIGLSSKDDSDPNASRDIGSTSVYHFIGNLGYLLDLGGAELGGAIGFGYDTFSLSDNSVLGPASYPFLRIAPMFRLPILDNGLLDLQVDAGARIAFGAGDIAQKYAESTGAFGLEAHAGVAGALDFGLSYAFRAGLVHYILSPSGEPPDAGDPQASGGHDTALRFMLLIGWTFR